MRDFRIVWNVGLLWGNEDREGGSNMKFAKVVWRNQDRKGDGEYEDRTRTTIAWKHLDYKDFISKNLQPIRY